MAWIESHQSIAAHPKTKRLTRLLGVPVPQVIGHLHMLWWWALDYAQDGDLSRYDAVDLADAMMWDGDPAILMAALVDAGFVDDADSPTLHDWDDYAGRLLDSRRVQTQRHKLHRDTDVTAAVKARDASRCRYCGIQVRWQDRKGALGGTYDHVHPRGENTPGNVVVACRGCSSRKGQRTPEEAGMALLAPPGADYLPPPVKSFVSKSALPTEPTQPTEPTEPAAQARAAAALEDLEISETDLAVGRLCRSWENATSTTVTAALGEKLADWLETLPEAAIVKAISETGAGGARNWRYCEAILRRYQAEGWADRPPPRTSPVALIESPPPTADQVEEWIRNRPERYPGGIAQ